MPYTNMSLEEMERLYKSVIRARLDDADLSDGSDYDILSKAVAVLANGNQAQGAHAIRQILPSTAEGEFLELHATTRGKTLQPAAGAAGVALLTEVAVPGGSPPYAQSAGAALAHADGSAYTIDAAVNLVAASWSGKTTAPGSTVFRVIIQPSVTGIAAGDVFSLPGFADPIVVREVIASINAVEVYEPLPSAPATALALTPLVAALASLTASATGASTNQDPGESLTFTPDDADVEPTARVLDLAGGGDIESPDELRQRVLAFMRLRPGSGNIEDYREWALETPGVRLSDAFVYPGFRGYGTVQVVPMGISGARMPSAANIAAIAAHIVSKASWMDDVSVEVWSPMVAVTDIDVSVDPASGFEPDWVGTFTVDDTVTGHGVSRVGLTASPVSSIEVGDRVVLPIVVGSRTFLEERTVRIVSDSGGVYYVEVDAPFSAAAANTVTLRPGGPLVSLVHGAIVELFDTMGPGDTHTSGVDTRHPSPGELWPDVLTVASLYRAIDSLDGAMNVIVNAPATDQTPSPLHRLQLGEVTIQWL